jgi:calcineurin-like phosphoesterase family protein
MNRIYFTADLHFGHPKKQLESPPYDEWLLDLWWRSVDRGDTVYILGDVTFLPTPKKILRRGCRCIKEYAKKYYLVDKKDTITES